MNAAHSLDTRNDRALGWAYPAGAEHDPRAPYNQPDADLEWEDVCDDAIEDEVDALTGDGLECGVVRWMQADAVMAETLRDHLDDLAHKLLIRRHASRLDALDEFIRGMRPWVEKYVDAWTPAQRNEYLAEHEAEAADRDD